MRIKFVLSFLAFGIFSATPVLADQVSGNFRELMSGKSSQDSFNDGNLGLDASDETIFSLRLSNFGEADKSSITPDFFEPKLDKDNNEEHSIVIALKHGDPFGGDSDRGRDKHEPVTIGGAPPSATVAIPEPASFTLVLFGLGALGIFLHRRSAL